MPINPLRIIPRPLRLRMVRALKSLQKPFRLWPIIAMFARPFRTVLHQGFRQVQLTPRLSKPLPAWSLLIMLLFGASIGFYASTIFSEVSGIGQSTSPDFTLATNPASITTPQGSLTSVTVTLTSLNSFAGSVNLNYTLSPAIANATIALNPSSVSLLTGAGTSTLTVSVPASTPLIMMWFRQVGLLAAASSMKKVDVPVSVVDPLVMAPVPVICAGPTTGNFEMMVCAVVVAAELYHANGIWPASTCGPSSSAQAPAGKW